MPFINPIPDGLRTELLIHHTESKKMDLHFTGGECDTICHDVIIGLTQEKYTSPEEYLRAVTAFEEAKLVKEGYHKMSLERVAEEFWHYVERGMRDAQELIGKPGVHITTQEHEVCRLDGKNNIAQEI